MAHPQKLRHTLIRDVFSRRGWLALDSFVIPAARLTIVWTYPPGGLRGGGSSLEIGGTNFGSSVDGLTVFIGVAECTELYMSVLGTLVRPNLSLFWGAF